MFAANAQGPRPGGSRAPMALAGTAFTYQGQLKKNGALLSNTCNFTFTLYSDQGGTAQVGGPSAVTGVNVANGLFTATVNSSGAFGTSAFNGDARWLKTALQCIGDVSATTLTPLQSLTPAPYALALPGMYTQQNTTSPNVVGGYSGNIITPTLVGATIGGGGSSGSPNRVWADYGAVGGGSMNTASGWHATVGGGYNNTASNDEATIGGGGNHYATGVAATIGGGDVNTAYGNYATVPGGRSNSAAGDYGFAAGRNAKAPNQGSFVWADSTNADFSSTGNNQFLIRAVGGVGISTTNPTANLEVAGGDLKVSKSGSGIVFQDSSKQTTAASKILDYNRTVPGSLVITTTEQVIGTITVTTGSSVLYQFSAQYMIAVCGVATLHVNFYIDGSMQDSATAGINGAACEAPQSVISQFGLASVTPGVHTFQIRASSDLDVPAVLVYNGRVAAINR